MDSKKINIIVSDELLKRLDESAKSRYMTRSDYIRQAVLASIKLDQDLPKLGPFAGQNLA